MNLKHIILFTWKTFLYNRDKSSLFLEISTILCISLCVGIILGLNAIFSDLLYKSEEKIKLTSPFIYQKINQDSVDQIHEGLNQKQINFLKQIKIDGLQFIPSKTTVIKTENKTQYILQATAGAPICNTLEEMKQFTIYDASAGLNILGLPMKIATFSCDWRRSSDYIIKVPTILWDKVYKNKILSYSVIITDPVNAKKNILKVEKLLEEKSDLMFYSTYIDGSYLQEAAILQKQIINIVFVLLCGLLLTLMIMNSMIFIKNRKEDWNIFYLFKISQKQTEYIIALRQLLLFAFTVMLGLCLGYIIAKFSPPLISNQETLGLGHIKLSYLFKWQDITLTYSFVASIFIFSAYLTSKGLHKNSTLKNKYTETSPPLQNTQTALTIKNLTLSYNTVSEGSVMLLNDINLNLASGILTGIMGVSGSGKTTLLNSIFDTKYLGKEIQIDIENTAYITQYPNLIQELTIKENLNLFSKYPAHKLQELSTLFGIDKVLNHYPRETSVGEKQRAALVRALLTNPSGLILDEPTASLDVSNKIKVIKIIKTMLEEKTLSFALLVAHDPVVIYLCDRVYILDNNRLELKK